MPEPWEVLSSGVVWSSPWLSVRRDAVRLPSGLELDDYYVVEQRDFLLVFAMTEADEVVLVKQYRHGARQITLELPSGLIEHGEEPMLAAARELREETGYAGGLECVGRAWVDPSRFRNEEFIFLGRVTRVADQALDPSEDIEVVLCPVADLPSVITRGEMTSRGSIGAALLGLRLLEDKRRQPA